MAKSTNNRPPREPVRAERHSDRRPDPRHKPEPGQVGQVVAMNEFGDGEIHGHRRTVKLARVVVGDQVRYSLPPGDKSYIYGELIKVIKTSEQRVDPQCKAFLQGCGGCQWLHFDYAEQLRWKTRILRDILKQRCPVPVKVHDIIPMEQPVAYRNKLSLRSEAGKLVNMQEFGDQAVSSAVCRVETLANQRARAVLVDLKPPRELLQVHVRSSEQGELGICLFATSLSPAIREWVDDVQAKLPELVGVGVQIGDQFSLLNGRDYLEYQAAGLAYQIPLNGFFQTNYSQAARLRELVIDQLAIGRGDSVLDLYCGCGFFSLPIARLARSVIGIENSATSTASAMANATRNGLTNIDFRTADTAAALQAFKPLQWQSILLDPPRQGCDAGALREILRLQAKRIVYVSCSPSALARDLKVLTAGGYLPRYCQPLDMFPHTAHMETVVTLVTA